MAHDTFVQATLNFPFFDEPSLFGTEAYRYNNYPETCHALFNVVERLTYLGTSDLRLDVARVSLLLPLREHNAAKPVIRAILMQQVRCLLGSGGRSKPYIHNVVGSLLQDLLSLCHAEEPSQRAEILVLLLQHQYYGPGDCSWVDHHGDDIQELLDGKVSVRYSDIE